MYIQYLRVLYEQDNYGTLGDDYYDTWRLSISINNNIIMIIDSLKSNIIYGNNIYKDIQALEVITNILEDYINTVKHRQEIVKRSREAEEKIHQLEKDEKAKEILAKILNHNKGKNNASSN